MTAACPACDGRDLDGFHRVEDVPTNSCLLVDDAAAARDFPTGQLDLAVCSACGFITNRAFDPGLAEYSDRYEETQSFSPRFVEFGRALAERWVERHCLQGARVLEVGCGKGEFLVWMAEAGIDSGVGIDPGVHPERLTGSAARRLQWIADFYDERYAGLEFDALVCRHTLEHIHPVGEFLRMMRSNIGDRANPVVLFELPDTTRVLEEVAFWDTYYEHCSYFTAGSLARLFRRCGFDVLSVELDFDGQYLLLEARPSPAPPDRAVSPLEDDMARLQRGVRAFQDGYQASVERWRNTVQDAASDGLTVVLWGGGSKAVAFLSGLGAAATSVAAAVDINPHKQGRFIAGTGHPVVAPEDLTRLQPDLVIVMNPIYATDIRRALDDLRLVQASLLTL